MKKILICTITTALLGLFLAGCGSGTTANGIKPTTATAANATLNTGDAVNDQILKFELMISAVTLTGSGGTATTGNLLSKPATVEFVHQAGTFEPLAVVNIPAGTYSGATLSVSNPEVVVVNSGVPTKVPATLSSSTITVTFSPAITITNSNSTVINFDLDLANSVTLNGNPVTSATVAAKFNVTTSTVGDQNNENDDNGEVEDVHGKVTTINAPNFTIQTAQSTITFVTDSNTKFKDAISSLSQLKVGDIVEVDGVTKSDGTKLATKVSLEEDASNNNQESEGIITAVTGNPATQITIAHQVDSEGQGNAPVTVDLGINNNTQFQVRADKLNLGSTPPFDAGHIGKGQRIQANTASAATTPMVADKIKLREQALIGTVAASPAPGSSGFTLNISPTSAFASLTGKTSVAVTIVNGTQQKVTPAAGATLRVRGLIFFNAGSYTMVAARIDGNN
ncbi:MAG TPA: DUF5666 domain-containing protein [Candidatus Solibacter sp.]|nr:DUF5666 domain-containing protein [Candidatus Solibacter sp.]